MKKIIFILFVALMATPMISSSQTGLNVYRSLSLPQSYDSIIAVLKESPADTNGVRIYRLTSGFIAFDAKNNRIQFNYRRVEENEYVFIMTDTAGQVMITSNNECNFSLYNGIASSYIDTGDGGGLFVEYYQCYPYWLESDAAIIKKQMSE